MFQSSVPVTALGFHDRYLSLGRLAVAVDDLLEGYPRWFAIIGNRKVGKTSLLLELARRTQAAELRFIVFDVMEGAPLSLELFRTLGLRILDACLSESLGRSLEHDLGAPAAYRAHLLDSEIWGELPSSLQRPILELIDRPADIHLLRSVLRLPEALGEALGVKLVIALDEFQELGALGSKRGGVDVFPIMRSIWQRHRHVTYFVSGSAKTMLTELVTARHSPFFQHFEMMELGPFSPEEALSFLMNATPDGFVIPFDVAVKGAELLGGQPFYLQLMGETLLRLPQPLKADALRAGLQELLFSRTGRLSLYFQSQFTRLVGRSTYLSAILQALSDGPKRLTDIAKAIGAPSGATVRYLERLGDDVVKGDDGLYGLADPTFALWLQWREPGGSVIPMTLLGDEAEKEVAQRLAEMGFELIYQSRASRGAFDLLGIRGGQSLGVQVKASPLPLRFSLEAWDRMEADGARLGWSWVIAAASSEGEGARFLDPKMVRRGREARLGEDAIIPNLLKWLSEQSRRALIEEKRSRGLEGPQ